jgi:hypothetical protein
MLDQLQEIEDATVEAVTEEFRSPVLRDVMEKRIIRIIKKALRLTREYAESKPR